MGVSCALPVSLHPTTNLEKPTAPAAQRPSPQAHMHPWLQCVPAAYGTKSKVLLSKPSAARLPLTCPFSFPTAHSQCDLSPSDCPGFETHTALFLIPHLRLCTSCIMECSLSKGDETRDSFLPCRQPF